MYEMPSRFQAIRDLIGEHGKSVIVVGLFVAYVYCMYMTFHTMPKLPKEWEDPIAYAVMTYVVYSWMKGFS